MTGLTAALACLAGIAALFAILRRATRPTPAHTRATPAPGTHWSAGRVVGTILLVWVTWCVLVPLLGLVLMVVAFLVWPR